MAPRRLNTLTLKLKLEVLKKLEMGKRQTDIAKEYGIARTTVSTFVKNKQKILAASESSYEQSKKRIRKSGFPAIEEATLSWLKSVQALSIPISGPMIQEKARDFARSLDQNNFIASNGWLSRFKQRYGIVFRPLGKENASASQEPAENWKDNVLKPIMEEYKDADVFSCAETGLFFSVLPSKTLDFKGEKCDGGEKNKDRLTVLLTANLNGSEKLKPLVIGKSKNPRCFKSVKALPVDYESNRKAWMTAEIFERWVRKLDQQFSSEKRKILMILDNCTAHPQITDLSAIKLCFLPSNSTSVFQPLDQGIIFNMKIFYRKLLIQKFIGWAYDETDFKISMLDAIEMVDYAWKLVTDVTIWNCFHHVGFCFDSPNEDSSQAVCIENATNDPVWDEYVNIDSDLATSGHLEDNNISKSSNQSASASSFEEKECESSEEEEDDEVPAPSCYDALKAVGVIRHFLRTQDKAEQSINKLSTIEEFLFLLQKEKQSKIMDYFS